MAREVLNADGLKLILLAAQSGGSAVEIDCSLGVVSSQLHQTSAAILRLESPAAMSCFSELYRSDKNEKVNEWLDANVEVS
eukprot:2173208-Amphidinium_carterae.1